MEKMSAPSSAKRDGPGHGLEQTTLDPLQRENRQVRRDNDPDRVKHGTLHFVSRLENLLPWRLVAISLPPQMANDVLHHHDCAIHDHPEIQGAQREQIRWNFSQVQANRGEQQRKRNGQG